jgi:metal-responsive CopG/Arc/MetJ family transcriptional regulator
MKRTTISLPDDLAQSLQREARRRDVSASEVTREALQTHLGLEPGHRRKLSFAALGRSGHASTARDMEELLEHEWNDDPRDR